MSEGWPTVRLGDLLLESRYGTSAPCSDAGTVPVVGIPHVKGGRVSRNVQGMASLGEVESAALSLRAGDILITRTNSPELVGRAGIVSEDSVAVFASYLVRLRVDTQRVVPDYLNYWLNSPDGRRQVRRLVTRAVCQANVNPTELRRHLRVPLPPLAEQQRIVDILAAWDAAIKKTERLIGVKTVQRTWLSKSLLDVPASAGEWPTVTLGEICRAVTRKNSTGATNVLTSSAKSGLVDQSEYFNKDVSGVDLAGYYLIQRGEFAYNRSTSGGYPFGAIKRLDRHEEGVLSTLYLCFELLSPDVSSDYLCHFFESGVMNRELGQICQAGARSHGLLNVTKADFFSLRIPLPSPEAQSEIVRVLDAADREITILRNLAFAYCSQRAALSQRLLSPGETGSPTERKIAQTGGFLLFGDPAVTGGAAGQLSGGPR